MTPIDLFDYANSSSKISAKVLSHRTVEMKQIKTWQIFSAYFLDFMTIFASTVMVSTFFELAFRNYMVTQKLQLAFSKIEFTGFSFNFIPMIFIGYFFFSFFFNRGQTWGMSVMKCRIEMEEQDFRSSFFWSMLSSIALMSGGAAILFGRKWIQQKGWGDFRGHDHLYTVLMQERVLAPVDLVEFSQQLQQQKDREQLEEIYLEAA